MNDIQLKIVSNGIGTGTKVVDAATGALLAYVKKAEWSVGVEEVAITKLTLMKTPVEIAIRPFTFLKRFYRQSKKKISIEELCQRR